MTHQRGRSMVARWLALLAGLLAVLAAGCGVPRDDSPRAIASDRLPDELVDDATQTTQPENVPGSRTALVYFIESERLESVRRDVPERTPAAVLATLFMPPTSEEGSDLTSNIPQGLTAVRAEQQDDGVVLVDLTDEINAVAGQTQKVAFAQMVYTLTELPGVSDVRFTLNDVPLEVPTDAGSVREPVDRGDFVSLAPASEGARTATTAERPSG